MTRQKGTYNAALTIGRNLIERSFPDKISKNTVYIVYEEEEDHHDAQLVIVVEAVFQPDPNVNVDKDYVFDNADVRIVLQWSIRGLTFDYGSVKS